MYDLKSEDPEEPGLPDEFHALQPQLLSQTFHPPRYPISQVFTASDLNLYYDVRHPQWYKRPDWFGVVGVSRLYDQTDLRLSYVVWQEGVHPFVVVELLSPGTEKEDLGEISIPENGQVVETADEEKPPRKWEVYEQLLRIPYYFVFSRYTNQLRAFKLAGGHYQELVLANSRIWLDELDLGLGLWTGEFQGIDRLWLRWFNNQGDWILTSGEQDQLEKNLAIQQAEQEKQRADLAETQLALLMQKLRESGIDPANFLNPES
jgi:Uma2 family endonuclease